MPTFGAPSVRPREAAKVTAMIVAVLALWLAADQYGDTVTLDRDGRQGAVAFDHAAHVKVAVDPKSPRRATATATCGGCHHTRDGEGVIQLAKCEGCHGPQGDPRNPKSAEFNEEDRKTAYHEMCIGCHADLAKASGNSHSADHPGPVDCADCHTAKPRGRG
jgi:hypothetical protein